MILLVNAFATSVLPEGESKFKLHDIVRWLSTSTSDEMRASLEILKDDANAETLQYAIDRCADSCTDLICFSQPLFCSFSSEQMSEAKANALVQDMALLCIIFPLQHIDEDSESGISALFPDSSALFRCGSKIQRLYVSFLEFL